MRRRSTKPPRPLRWNPPVNVQRMRRRRRFEIGIGIGILSLVIVTGAATEVAVRQKRVDQSARWSAEASSAHDPPLNLVRANATPIGERRGDALPHERFTCTVASVTDGDTLRCVEGDATGRQIRVRISGIDAREKDGTCAPGHPCASASAEAATAELQRLVSGQILSCKRVGETYGRVAAWCDRADGIDVSCAMMASGTVARWWKYWGLHRC
jgi:endonuclease YncB( thermonuclease family)